MRISIAEFEETYLPVMEEEFKQDTMDSVMEHHDSICKQLWKEMETTAKFAVKFQQQIPIPIGEMQISLLVTSLYLDKPQIGIAAYDMRGIYGNELFQIKYDASWLFTQWDKYRNKILQKIEELHVENYIHAEAVRQMMHKSIPFLMQSMCVLAKYPLREFEKLEAADELLLTESFRLTIGGYRDWSRILYVRRPQLDIFFHDSSELLRYCKFNEAVYNHKEFNKLDLMYTKFVNCEFVHCDFKNVEFQDVVFEHCRIYHCTFENVNFSGGTFIDTTLKKNVFHEITWNEEPKYMNEIQDFYKGVEFIDCITDDEAILKQGV